MPAIASTVMSRLRSRTCAATLALMLLPASAWAQAPIQITPLPEAKHATVTQLGASDLDPRDLQAWLDTEMGGVMQQGGVTGAVVVVVKDGELLYSKGYGYADAVAKKPIDPAATMFRVGTMSGIVTATTVMQLVDRHKLDLDADVNRYLDFTIPTLHGKPVTLRDLLTNTAGFEEMRKGLYITDPKRVDRDELGIHHGGWLPARVYPAGEVPAYSVYGMALTGYIVQRVSGQRFDEYAERHVFEPLGMRRSTFRQSRSLWSGNADGGVAGEPTSTVKLVVPTPALGLAISGEDAAKLMIAHLQYGRADNAQLLEQATVQQMQAYRRSAIPGLPGMAIGLAQLDTGEPTILGQDGDFDDSHSLLALVPEHHTGIFIATAGGNKRLLLRPLLSRFAKRYFPPLPELRPATIGTDKAHSAQLAGRYASSITSHSNVLALRDLFHQDTISVGADGSLITPMFGAAHWREVKPYLWLDDASGRHLGALVRDGKVSMLSVDTVSPVEVYLPSSGWPASRVLSVVIAILGVFALIALSWPAVALLRRREISTLTDQDLRWYRLSRLTALLYLLFAGGWCLLLPRLGVAQLDTRLRLLHLIGILAVLGTLGVALECWRAWRHGGSWWRRISATIELLACLAAIAFIVCWHLLSPGLNY